MKKRIYKYWLLLLLTGLLTACDDYLDKTESADLTEKDVFGTYEDFQGFVDQMYGYVIPYFQKSITGSLNYGDHVINNRGFSPSGAFDGGNYWYVWSNTLHNILYKLDNGTEKGLWSESWYGIRAANVALSHMDDLVSATQEEKDLLKGQAHFFRAYFHWELIRFWGGLPYIDRAFKPSDNMQMPRLSYRETTERLIADLDTAAMLLPEDWDRTSFGQLISTETQSSTVGRATKGAALGIKAKALMYAASPLMNDDNGYQYNTVLCERTAEAAWNVIELADKGIYKLLPWSSYSDNFHKNDGSVPWTDEVIWEAINPGVGNSRMNNFHGRIFNPGRFGGNAVMEAPTQNIVDLFEMANGYPIEHPSSGYDPNDPWTGRDPRFYNAILLDGTKWILKNNNAAAYIQTYIGGQDRGNDASRTGYMIKKYWPIGVNKVDKNWNQFRFQAPHLRLADIYLIYAEAVNEVYGPNEAPTFNGKTGMTATEAVNIIRNRANMPSLTAEFSGSKDALREKIRNERAIEFCFEGHRWFDLRRWHIAHLPEYKPLYGLEFDKNHTYFKKVWIQDRVFDERNYWLPLPVNQTQLYEGFGQNTGW
ncbi:RagB/SusD family nutrient uptake outer membrane protein [Limibacter armeniacum]|uniref:RagB/SusD family nutrient uptake outer membrane protein n=1 Tax=Limibacter armeniacum TaxID=466084 RepID=UPI002FE5D362